MAFFAGLMSADAELTDELASAGERSDDRAWRLPLAEEYGEQLKSNFADMANTGGREGGAITAACFLSKFAQGMRWAHLDIAGPAYNEGPPHGYTPKGGTGAATRTLVQIAQDMADGRL